MVLKENVPATYSYGSEKILSIYSTTQRKNDKANVVKDQNVGNLCGSYIRILCIVLKSLL